ncbi:MULTISPECIES: hypothetical protein [Streptomyces]|uniref:Lipoprotein n=1 Tax=Streptomyces venezuelae (strain ATCC 10712 / CBS 650.69 / DSM 40230 / JCM 4526 / NBRC 13096 / PD 04745) TaxID=953739 RepID=F2RAA2_STRVP|nr:hypothetical protein [Streptomyces venezuelae]CCA56584.1 hypothetical protein SVEN_3298 [Streptomyces venezuelae ATCC 10712]
MTMLRKPLTAVAPLVLISLLAAGCTDDAKPSATPSASATEKPTATEPPQGENEEEQGKRAKAALETVSLDDPEFVESGLERVREGVHNLSPLKKGKAYKVSVACVGTGNVKVVIADKAPQSVPCDGVPAAQRVENAPAELPIDITATSGAMGMVAWQVISLSS